MDNIDKKDLKILLDRMGGRDIPVMDAGTVPYD